jgi:hypothetical protein
MLGITRGGEMNFQANEEATKTYPASRGEDKVYKI